MELYKLSMASKILAEISSPPWELIINEGDNTLQIQKAIQMACKIHVSIFTSETQEHIIFVLVGDGGRGGLFVC